MTRSAPKQQLMEAPEFKAAYLNVRGYDLTVDHHRHYTYKVPYAIQLKPRCCECCRTGPQDAMDFVDQETGDQIRFHRFRKQVRVFHNGQYRGAMTRTWLCCGRTRVCCQEICKADIPLVSFWDESGQKFGSVARKGKGCCCTCRPNFPCRCIHGSILGVLPISFFGCCSCTCECYPDNPKTGGWPWCCGFLNGRPTLGLPHGFFLCPCLDVACCECCVRGPTKVCGCVEYPCICCSNPCGLCACICPVARCTGYNVPIKSTFKYAMGPVKKGGERVGDFQVQYRGNCPYKSGWLHNANEPYAVAMEAAKGGPEGMVMSALLAARSYILGLTAPMLEDLNTGLSSPDFDGKVMTVKSPEVDALLAALDNNNNVTTDVTFGSLHKINVRGYTLLKVGYDNAWCTCGPATLCGGLSMAPKYVRDRATSVEYVANGRSGGTRPTFFFHFYIQDPEKQIINRQTAGHQVDRRFYDFFYDVGRERLYCECQWVRFWKFPLDFTRHRFTCCRCPCDIFRSCCLDKKVVPVDAEGKAVEAPNQIIMTPGKTITYAD
mmetsp:Transcript_62786/g.187187  ORF Transcript_62786/g.187187 Transcript_62786/m.187187 type:complete len:549 (+) Transcript_62786:3-1649(+)